MNHSIAYVNEGSTINLQSRQISRERQELRQWLVQRFEISMSSFIPRNLTDIEAVAGCTFACIYNTVFRMFSCLHINCQPFYLHQLLKFHPFDWLIKFIFNREPGYSTQNGIAPTSAWFSPLFIRQSRSLVSDSVTNGNRRKWTKERLCGGE